jgi:recombination protein RecA
MGTSRRQLDVLIGIVMGDGYLQKTGSKNARLRLEHSAKQKDYILWKHDILANLMQSRPKLLKRFNPVWKKTYSYYRCQSHSSPVFGMLRRLFYGNGRKIIPENIDELLRSAVSLAVWYMDDGYFYNRDKSAYIYMASYPRVELDRLLYALANNFKLRPGILVKKGKYPCLYFSVDETRKLMDVVRPYIIPSLSYKTLPTP